MRNEFTALVQRDGPFYFARCAEVPEANGQGDTVEGAIEDLRAAIALVLEDERDDALREIASESMHPVVVG